MNSLFMRLFSGFWLLLLIIVLCLSLLQRYWTPYAGLPSQSAMAEYAQELEQLYQEDGHGALRGYLRSLSRQQGLRFVLLDSSGNPLGRRGWQGRDEDEDDNSLFASRSVSTRSTPLALDDQPHQLQARYRHRGLQDIPLWLQLSLVMVASTALAAWLARTLSRPLRQVREASKRLAAGDLAVRVPEKGRAGDELHGLCADFNRMAGQLQQLMAARDRLTRDISHELRSPLARMQVAMALARRQAPELAEGPMNRMEQEIEQLDELVGQLLSLARLESADSRLQLAQLDLSTLAREVSDNASYEARERQITVHCDLPEQALIRGDRRLLASALDNVLRNAIHYSPEPGQVWVNLSQQGGNWQVAITDQGPGVPEQELEAIFAPFARVSCARERDGGGYGVGLAIVKRAIEAHGGLVQAKNASNTGASPGLTVILSLPVLSTHPEREQPNA
ncbi:MAG: HAMP domain-containing protein [Halomonadaceae bacterium]|nr:MAG: HAMP domain-containing protein [Halomonadaceae bacterium]